MQSRKDSSHLPAKDLIGIIITVVTVVMVFMIEVVVVVVVGMMVFSSHPIQGCYVGLVMTCDDVLYSMKKKYTEVGMTRL